MAPDVDFALRSEEDVERELMNEKHLRDLLAWSLVLVERAHQRECPARQNTGACTCQVADFASEVRDLEIDICASCQQAEAIAKVHGVFYCGTCAKEHMKK